MQNQLRHTGLWMAFCGLCGIVLLLFSGAPGQGAFDWSDAPRHALNGVFLLDFIHSGQWLHPVQFANDYYGQYPALTILLYPPLFYILSIPFYAIFGVSHSTALLVVFLHYVAFAIGAWSLFRFCLNAWEAFVAAVILITVPEIAYWGRQVMLEIPAFAFLIWSAVFFLRYRTSQRALHLYLCALLLLLSMYTKISTGFMGLVYALTLFNDRRALLLRDRQVWFAAVISLMMLVPLILMTLKFGQANVQSVVGINDAVVSRFSPAGWLWYLRQFPDQLGWPLTIAAGLMICWSLVQRNWKGMPAHDQFFWTSWLVVGYLFFSAIDLKEARHDLFIFPPLILAAVLFFKRCLPARIYSVSITLLAGAVLIQTLVARPVHYVRGYAQAAQYIASNAAPGGRVLFSGYRDGSFIFNMREQEQRRDISVIRADKLLLNVSIRRELGVTEHDLTERQINDQINQLGIQYLVIQPGFWNDLEVMRKFEHVLASGNFKVVAQIATPANYSAHEKVLVIYKNLGKFNERPDRLGLNLPAIRRATPDRP